MVRYQKKAERILKNITKISSVFLPLPLSSFAAQSEHGPAQNSEQLWQVLLLPDSFIFRVKGGS